MTSSGSRSGILFVVSAPSGTGKSSVSRKLLESDGELEFSVSYTTRAPRAGDELEDNYYFIDEAAYRRMVEDGAFIEHKDYLFGMSYGLPHRETAELLARHDWVLALINLGRFGVVKRDLPDALGVLITVPVQTVERRLRKRGTSNEEQIAERLENARLSFAYAPDYDLVVDNDDGRLDQAVARIRGFLD